MRHKVICLPEVWLRSQANMDEVNRDVLRQIAGIIEVLRERDAMLSALEAAGIESWGNYKSVMNQFSG